MKKRVLTLMLILAVVVTLAACSSETSGGQAQAPGPSNTGESQTPATNVEPATPEKEKVIRLAMTTSMGDMDPFAFSSTGRNNMRYMVYEYLAVFKDFGSKWQDMNWVLAKNITQIDEVTYQIEIYDYIVDAIGNPVTASDVAFCMNTMATNGSQTRVTSYLKSCTAINDYTAEIVLNTTLVGVIEYIMCQVNIVSEKTYNEHKDDMSTTPITTAAYQITECVNGSYYTVEKNPNYWQKDESKRGYYAQQPVDKFVYNIITEGSQATIALQMGEVDIITSVRPSELSYFLNVDGTAAPGYSVNGVIESTPVMLGFNMQAGSMFDGNLALRQAICYAIDSDEIIVGALDGYGERTYDPAPSGCTDFNAKWLNEDYYNTDLTKAKELMAEAGYADGKNPATKSALHIRLLCDSLRKDAAVIIQAQLAKLGIDVEVVALDDAMFKEYNYDPTRWDIFICKQGTEAYITNVYDGILLKNKDGVSAKSFGKDDTLQELMDAAHNVKTHNAESIDALHYYVKDNAYLYGLYCGYTFTVGSEGIQLVNHPWNPVVPSACDYTAFFAK